MYNNTRLETESQALKLIRQQIDRIYCPRCRKKHYIKKQKYDHRYYCFKCRYAFSLKILLGFNNSKLSYKQILILIHCFSKKYNLNIAMEQAKVSYPTIRYAYDRIRLLLPKTKDKLQGDIIVDEAFVGKKKNNNQCIIAGAVNREFNQVRIKLIPNREQHTLEQFLLDHVEIISFITTDAHTSYYDIEWYGYGHRIENHSKFQLKYSCPIERVWALFKTMLRRVYHHIWKESINKYLVEFIARFNHKEIVNNPSNLLAYILKSAPSA